MNKVMPIIVIFLALPALTYFYYIFSFGVEVDKVFLSISTFLFSIFTGFFISRQAGRFNKVRETVTKFDGILSGVYRVSGHISHELQQGVGDVVRNHYERILNTKKWNIHFLEKSSTLTNIHLLMDKHVGEEKVPQLANQAIGRVLVGMASCQDVRKQMVALHEERIPAEQWILIGFFVVILIGTVSTMPSVGLVLPSILKAAFIVSVLSVMLILHRLNNLVFTEKLMGEHSALDVLGIIDGSK